MKQCILDLENIQEDAREDLIFFANHDIILYKDEYQIKLASCDGSILSEARCPRRFMFYEMTDIPYLDSVLFVFGGKTIILVHRNGTNPINIHDFNVDKFGVIITKPYYSKSLQKVIFGTKQADRTQFMSYDLISHSRYTQTMSWDFSTIDSVSFYDPFAYLVGDRSTIIKCDMTTSEVIYKRFEAGKMGTGIIQNTKTDFIYACDHYLKINQNGIVKTQRIPIVRLNGVERLDTGQLICRCKDNQNLCCIYTDKNVLKWEIFGNKPILDSLFIDGIKNKRTYKIAVLQLEEHIALVNLTLGEVISYIKCPQLFRIRQSDNHLLLQRRGGLTTLIAGIES